MKPDLDAIRARCEAARVILDPRSVVMPCIEDIPALLAHVDMLEHMLAEERENVDNLQDMVADLERRFVYGSEQTGLANRIAHAEQRFVDEYDRRKAAERQVEELKARIVTLEAMKP